MNFCSYRKKPFSLQLQILGGGAVASWLARLSLNRAVWVQALAGTIALCSWARHFPLTVPLYIKLYKSVLANVNAGGNPAMD